MINQSLQRDPSGDIRQRQWMAEPSESQQYYLTLLRALPLVRNENGPRVHALGITSCYRGEGVSTAASQLSIAAASSGLQVVLVDANGTNPSVHSLFAVERAPGLSDAMVEESELGAAIRATSFERLSVLPIGSQGYDFNRSYSVPNMTRLLDQLRVDYDLIICDLPPVESAGITVSISSLLDGVVLIVEAERVRWEVAARAKELLLRGSANILGAVMNKRLSHIPNWLYHTL